MVRPSISKQKTSSEELKTVGVAGIRNAWFYSFGYIDLLAYKTFQYRERIHKTFTMILPKLHGFH